MLVESAEFECRVLRNGLRQPPIRVCIDDLIVTASSVPGCRWILPDLKEKMIWARPQFRIRGNMIEKFRFNVAATIIPSLKEK